ncbi:NAD(P)H-dependent oxidoreductase subunit E [Pseudothioclava arenosa]|uniref:NADH-quinone oxidoreductase subunit E n=1 Tax=Pseudothioclava arenosa TaxID=1795308 RepID=A0A2A4CLC3_9RHOB|nr:NAD(P)H-dependent oxidoreductase subunit E [Pseudothioclava arenosa]PCD76061.1 NADH-quinone oxidoreductase subunit E [Pseudothioclava arenosa]
MSQAERISEIVACHRGREGALLPMLHELQAAFGCVPVEAHKPICAALGITAAELQGVIAFYEDFRAAPQGRHVIRVCRAEACQAMGAEAMIARLERALGVRLGETVGAVTLEAVYCLGLCACGPAAQVDDRLIARATPERLAEEVRA